MAMLPINIKPDPTSYASAYVTSGSLSENTTYYAKFGVDIQGTWYWSSIVSATTGSAPILTTQGMPTISTGVPTNITTSSFVAHGTIEATNNTTVRSIGFDYRNQHGIELSFPDSTNAPYAVGNYTMTFSGLSDTTTVYVRFHIQTTNANWYDIVGQWQPLLLTGTVPTSPVSVTPPQGNGSPTDVSLWVVYLARIQGLDNPFGHYAFMLEIMLLVAFIMSFGIIACLVKDRPEIAKVLGWILLILILIILIAFIFTGWLGIMPFVVGGVIVVIAIIIIINLLSNKGNGG